MRFHTSGVNGHSSSSPALPTSLDGWRSVLGGGRKSRCGQKLHFPDPWNPKRGKYPCTLWLTSGKNDGFRVSDSRGRDRENDIRLKDKCRELAGAVFTPRQQNSSMRAQRAARGPGVRGRSGKDRRKGEGGASRLRLLHFNAIKLSTKRRDLIRGLIPRVGLVEIWGAPSCGKTFLTLDLVMHVALGWEYRGRRVHQGPVIYCALEGQTGIEGRIEAWRLRHLAEEIEDVPFYLQPVTLDLINQHQELIDLIRGELGTEAPAVVVIDTLNRSLHGSESSDEDMGNYIRAADAVRDAFDCAVIIVHHCGHNGDRPRGHSSQIGAAEAVIGVRKESAGQIIATVEKMKDGPNGETIASRLDGVVVGEDEDGEEITSCVVVPIEWIPPAKSHKTKLGPKEQIALKALQYAISETGEPAPSSNHIPDGTNVVTRECWSGYAIRKGISDSDQPRAKNQAFKRAVDGLLAKGCVGQWGDLVWPIT